MSPMTHENGSFVVRVPSQRTQVPIARADPTPMSTDTTETQSPAESNGNDRKWLNNEEFCERILAYIERRASLTKSWFKPGFIAHDLNETPQAVGPALAAMYRSEEYPQIVERRSADASWVYRVEVSE